MRKLLIVLISLILIIGVSYLVYYYFFMRSSGNLVQTPPQDEDTTQVDSSKIIFESNFDDPVQADDWEIFDDLNAAEKPSSWFFEDGVLKQNSNIWAGTFGLPVLDKTYLGSQIVTKEGNAWKDYKVTFRFKPLDNDGVGFLVRYKNINNYIRFITVLDSTQGNGGPFLKVDKRVNGVTTGLYSKKVSYKLGQWNNTTILVKGERVTFYLDDNKNKSLIYGIEKSLKAGRFGFSVFAEEGVEFDDVVVRQL